MDSTIMPSTSRSRSLIEGYGNRFSSRTLPKSSCLATLWSVSGPAVLAPVTTPDSMVFMTQKLALHVRRG